MVSLKSAQFEKGITHFWMNVPNIWMDMCMFHPSSNTMDVNIAATSLLSGLHAALPMYKNYYYYYYKSMVSYVFRGLVWVD